MQNRSSRKSAGTIPNYCTNIIMINGETEILDALAEFIKSDYGDVDFNKLIMSPVFGKNSDGLDSNSWCMDHWGTKWNAKDIDIVRINENELKIEFETAWSPSIPIVDRLAELFPKASINYKYFESDFDFSGIKTYKNGLVIEDKEGSYDDYADE